MVEEMQLATERRINDSEIERRILTALNDAPLKIDELRVRVTLPERQQYRLQGALTRMNKEHTVEFRAGVNVWARIGSAVEKATPSGVGITDDSRTRIRIDPDKEKAARDSNDALCLDSPRARMDRQLRDEASEKGETDSVTSTLVARSNVVKVLADCDLRTELIALSQDLRTKVIDTNTFDRCLMALNAACAIDQAIDATDDA